jgi:hypothetical protein
MNKRGQSEVMQLMTLFEILVGIMVATFLILGAVTFNSQTKFEKNYIEEDMKLMVNSLLASPSYIEFNYTYPKHYDIKLGEDKIEVIKDVKISNLGEKHSLILTKEGPLDSIGGKLNV